MTLHLYSITFDAADPQSLARFWADRMHVDLGTGDLEAETERVLGLGAQLVGRYDEYGVTWASFRDPEGNEFCIGLHDPPQH